MIAVVWAEQCRRIVDDTSQQHTPLSQNQQRETTTTERRTQRQTFLSYAYQCGIVSIVFTIVLLWMQTKRCLKMSHWQVAVLDSITTGFWKSLFGAFHICVSLHTCTPNIFFASLIRCLLILSSHFPWMDAQLRCIIFSQFEHIRIGFSLSLSFTRKVVRSYPSR